MSNVVVRKTIDEDINDIWDRTVKANSLIKTIKVKDNDYAQVNQRVKAFRYLYPKGRIDNKLSITGEEGHRLCLCETTIYDDMGNILANGHAEEKEGSTFINKTSFVENAESSSVGRALSFINLGIEVSIASAEEVENAMLNQSSKKPTQTKLSYFAMAYSSDEQQKIREYYKVSSNDELPREIIDKYVEERKGVVKEEKAKIKSEWESKPDKENPFY